MPNFDVPKFLRLPSPVDLGWSEHNALGMREFTPYQEGKTWEDWREHVQKLHPFKYWLNEVFPLWFKKTFVWPVERVKNTVLDYVSPSRRHHILDLRGIDPLSDYRHGYMDPCTVMWLAAWGSLMRWHHESNINPEWWNAATVDEALDKMPEIQAAQYREASALVHFWTVTRKERADRDQVLYQVMKAIEPTKENQEAYEAADKEWLDFHRETDRLEEEMGQRLWTLRSFLWD